MKTVRVTSISVVVATLIASGFACGGSGGCSSLQSLFGIGRDRASAEALAGRYRLENVSRTPDSCEGAGKGSEESRVRGWIRLERIAPSGGTSPSGGTAEAERDAPRLEFAMCTGGDACESPEWRMSFAESETGTWEAVRGSALPEREGGPARRCRLSSERFRVAPSETGVRVWRIRRVEFVPLEGDTRCEPETAVEYEERLDCLETLTYRAVRQSS